MPDKNCAFVVSCLQGGYSIFNVPKGEDEWCKNLRKQLIDIITKYCVVDVKFRCQIKKKKLVFVSNIYENPPCQWYDNSDA